MNFFTSSETEKNFRLEKIISAMKTESTILPQIEENFLLNKIVPEKDRKYPKKDMSDIGIVQYMPNIVKKEEQEEEKKVDLLIKKDPVELENSYPLPKDLSESNLPLKKRCLRKGVFENGEEEHLPELPLLCDHYNCFYLASNQDDLQKHNQFLHKFSCKVSNCRFTTRQKGHLNRHVAVVHLRKLDLHCEVENCAYRTARKYSLDIHYRTKHLKEFEFICSMEKCGYETNRKEAFISHFNVVHMGCYNMRCKEVDCTFKTNSKAAFLIHYKTKHLQVFDYDCIVEGCDFRTNIKNLMNQHVRCVHEKKEKHQCPDCIYRSDRKIDFMCHYKKVHLDVFDFRCEKEGCGFKTNHTRSLKRHIRIHK
jgi:hypothetical protein